MVGTTENASGTTVDLTAEGTTDWAQFPTEYADDYAKKNTETVITNFHRLVSDDTPYAVDVAKAGGVTLAELTETLNLLYGDETL